MKFDMKKQILYMLCLAAMMSSCHIYKAYDRLRQQHLLF